MPQNNTVDYVEIPSRDVQATCAFFTDLFGWSWDDYGPDYQSFDDGHMTGGVYRSEKVATVAAGGTLIVFYHTDLEHMHGRARDLGAQITRDIFEFPGGRRFHFLAPGGGEFAIWSE